MMGCRLKNGGGAAARAGNVPPRPPAPNGDGQRSWAGWRCWAARTAQGTRCLRHDWRLRRGSSPAAPATTPWLTCHNTAAAAGTLALRPPLLLLLLLGWGSSWCCGFIIRAWLYCCTAAAPAGPGKRPACRPAMGLPAGRRGGCCKCKCRLLSPVRLPACLPAAQVAVGAVHQRHAWRACPPPPRLQQGPGGGRGRGSHFRPAPRCCRASTPASACSMTAAKPPCCCVGGCPAVATRSLLLQQQLLLPQRSAHSAPQPPLLRQSRGCPRPLAPCSCHAPTHHASIPSARVLRPHAPTLCAHTAPGCPSLPLCPSPPPTPPLPYPCVPCALLARPLTLEALARQLAAHVVKVLPGRGWGRGGGGVGRLDWGLGLGFGRGGGVGAVLAQGMRGMEWAFAGMRVC